MENKYQVVDDFQVRQMRVLVLDRTGEFGKFNRMRSDGQIYPFVPNSVPNWITVTGSQSFKGKTVEMVRP